MRSLWFVESVPIPVNISLTVIAIISRVCHFIHFFPLYSQDPLRSRYLRMSCWTRWGERRRGMDLQMRQQQEKISRRKSSIVSPPDELSIPTPLRLVHSVNFIIINNVVVFVVMFFIIFNRTHPGRRDDREPRSSHRSSAAIDTFRVSRFKRYLVSLDTISRSNASLTFFFVQFFCLFLFFFYTSSPSRIFPVWRIWSNASYVTWFPQMQSPAWMMGTINRPRWYLDTTGALIYTRIRAVESQERFFFNSI